MSKRLLLFGGIAVALLAVMVVRMGPLQGLLQHVKNMANDDACQCEEKASNFPSRSDFTVCGACALF